MYPNPLTVRTVKAYLKDAACDAGMLGASAVVQAVMGSAWGYLFSKSNRRDYLNFIGELAGRTVSPAVENLATQIYQNNHVTYKDGSWKVEIPANMDRNSTLLNDSGDYRLNNHRYDTVAYGSDLTKKFRYQPKSELAAKSFQGPRDQVAKSQSSKNNKNKNRNKGNNQNLPVKVKPNQTRDMSECPLSEALDQMCNVGYDFSVMSSLTRLFGRIKSLFTGKSKDESSKAVLQGCYEYLEENGYDAYPIMLDIINDRTASDFSETLLGEVMAAMSPEEDTDEVTLTDLQMFRKCANIYSTLTLEQKDILRGYLGSQCGPKPATEYLWDLSRYSEVGVQPTKGRMRAFKALALFVTALSALKVLFTTTSKAERIN